MNCSRFCIENKIGKLYLCGINVKLKLWKEKYKKMDIAVQTFNVMVSVLMVLLIYNIRFFEEIPILMKS